MIIWYHHVGLVRGTRDTERGRESFEVRIQNSWTQIYKETLFNLSHSSLLNQVKILRARRQRGLRRRKQVRM